MTDSGFWQNGWPKAASDIVAFDGGDPSAFAEPLDPLIKAVCDIKGCSPANLSGHELAKAERVVQDGVGLERFLVIIAETKARGGKWNEAVMQAWAEVKSRGEAAVRRAGADAPATPSRYDAEKNAAWFALDPLERARRTIEACRKLLELRAKLPEGMDMGDVKNELRRAENELARRTR